MACRATDPDYFGTLYPDQNKIEKQNSDPDEDPHEIQN
jgi:hypothetical protein